MYEDIFPKLCMNCKWSKPDGNSSWSNRCFHPKVVMHDSFALGNNREGDPYGVSCSSERDKRSWFAQCGMRGLLYEAKEIK